MWAETYAHVEKSGKMPLNGGCAHERFALLSIHRHEKTTAPTKQKRATLKTILSSFGPAGLSRVLAFVHYAVATPIIYVVNVIASVRILTVTSFFMVILSVALFSPVAQRSGAAARADKRRGPARRRGNRV